MKKYDVILADPPWDFRVWDKDTGSGRYENDAVVSIAKETHVHVRGEPVLPRVPSRVSSV